MGSNMEKAELAVFRAAEYFRSLGFETSDPKHPARCGTDLEIWRQGQERFKVEVKAVGLSKGAWRARGRHMKSGEDYIAFVFPSGHVYVEDHVVHERMRCADGGRHISKIAKLFLFSKPLHELAKENDLKTCEEVTWT